MYVRHMRLPISSTDGWAGSNFIISNRNQGWWGLASLPIPGIPHPDVCTHDPSGIDKQSAGTPNHRSRFLPADALWNLAMAINVYMTLFRKYNAQQLKSLEWRYHLMCYGCPFIVALVYIFVHAESRGPIYGPATLWCWIDINWVALRIATCYAPAWCCILISFSIYALSGREIFLKRQQLRAFSHPPTDTTPIENPFTDFKTTEIQITSELATLNSLDVTKVFLSPDGRIGRQAATPSPSRTHYDPYTVTIGSAPMSAREVPMSATSPGEEVISPSSVPKMELPQFVKPSLQHRKNRAALEANAAAWGYTKVALLFFVSLLITWVRAPSPSMSAVYGQGAKIDTSSYRSHHLSTESIL